MQYIILTIALFFSTLLAVQTKVNEHYFALHNKTTFMKAEPLYTKSSKKDLQLK